jgi:hypothetical protein
MDDKEKSIFKSVTDTMKNTIDIATEAAKKALEPEPIKPDLELVAIPAPLSIGDDYMSPMPPMIAVVKKKQSKKSAVDTSGRITPAYDFPVPNTPLPTKKTAKKAKTKPAKTTAKKAVKKSKARKAAKKSASKTSAKKKTAKKKTANKVAKKTKTASKNKSKKSKR